MNEFRMSLLKERADAIRPDLTKARKMIEAAEAEHRDLTDEEKAFTEPVLKSARDVADSMAKTRHEDATMKAIADEFGPITGQAGAQLRQFGSEFGLSPVAERRLGTIRPPVDDDGANPFTSGS